MTDESSRFNVELKARCQRLDEVRNILLEAGAVLHGIDRQTDTFFQVPRGRLKVREGSIENALIGYDRPDEARAKPCHLGLMELSPSAANDVRGILEAALPLGRTVVKHREILFLGNVKFHLDEVEELGSFVEIEALSRGGRPGRDVLEAQVAEWRERLDLRAEDMVAGSYADLLTHLTRPK